MKRARRKGAEEARNQFSDLLEAAESGDATIITRHGRAIAALVPLDQYESRDVQQSIVPLKGTGRGLWGGDSAATLRKLRDEWNQ